MTRNVMTRRDFLHLFFTAAVAGIAAACTPAKPDPGEVATPVPGVTAVPPTPKPVAEKVKLTYWAHNNPAWVAGDKEILAAWAGEHPDIEIEHQPLPYGEEQQKLQTTLPTGQAADLVMNWGDEMYGAIYGGQLAAFPDELKAKVEDEYWPAAYTGLIYNGELYGLPHEIAFDNGLLMNVGHRAEAGITKAPETTDDLLEQAKALTILDDQERVTREGIGWIFSDQAPATLMEAIVEQGGKYWADDGAHVTFSTPEATAALQAMVDLVQKHKVSSVEIDNSGLSRDEIFYKGKASMLKIGPWLVATGEAEFPSVEVEYEIGPSFVGKPRRMAAGLGWTLMVPKSSATKPGVWDFIQFRSRAENLRIWGVNTGTIPSAKALQGDSEVVERFPYFVNVFGMEEDAFWFGPICNYGRFMSDGLYTNIVLALQGEQDIPTSLSNAESLINDMIDEYRAA